MGSEEDSRKNSAHSWLWSYRLYNCGATGSITAVKLARLGIGKIIAVDPDILEEHNLENQVYTEKDIGRPKVLALKRIVREIDLEVKFRGYASRIEDLPESALEADFYLGCFDNIAARYYLNAFAVFKSKPLMDSGIMGFTGTVRTFVPGKTSCLEC